MCIHPTAIVEPGAKLGRDVSIGPFSIIHANTELGDGATVGPYCELGVPSSLSCADSLIIGAGAQIRSHCTLYAGSSIGAGLRTGHHVTVRERATIGRDAQLGTLGDIQGDCTIGDHFRSHSNVHIGKHSQIGNFVWIFPFTVLTNDPHPPSHVQLGCKIEDYAVVATMCVVLPGITVGRHAVVGAQSRVSRDVPPHMLASGNPARVVGPASEVKLRDGTGEPAYPWPSHFRRGYPSDATFD